MPAPIARKHDKQLLCLHGSAGSGAILRKQMMPLKLHEAFDLCFLDGAIEVRRKRGPQCLRCGTGTQGVW
jgi:hypothetical protein